MGYETTRDDSLRGMKAKFFCEGKIKFEGALIAIIGDFIIIHDDYTGKKLILSSHFFKQGEETTRKAPPERDRDSPGRLW